MSGINDNQTLQGLANSANSGAPNQTFPLTIFAKCGLTLSRWKYISPLNKLLLKTSASNLLSYCKVPLGSSSQYISRHLESALLSVQCLAAGVSFYLVNIEKPLLILGDCISQPVVNTIADYWLLSIDPQLRNKTKLFKLIMFSAMSTSKLACYYAPRL